MDAVILPSDGITDGEIERPLVAATTAFMLFSYLSERLVCSCVSTSVFLHRALRFDPNTISLASRLPHQHHHPTTVRDHA